MGYQQSAQGGDRFMERRNIAMGIGVLAGSLLMVFGLVMGYPWVPKIVEAEDDATGGLPATVLAGISTGFETNSTEGWTARIGHEAVTVSAAERRSGNFSLLTGNRRNAFDGCKINVTAAMTTGLRYRVSVWAKLPAGEAATNLKVSLERRLAGNTTFHYVVNGTVTSGEWVKLTTLYDHTLSHDALWLYVESVSGTSSFYIDDFELIEISPLQIQNSLPSLHERLAPHFKFGAAVWQGDVSGGAHSQLLRKHFNSITSENDMKWGLIHPTETTYNYGPADAQVNFAVANAMQVRGHALVWHEQNPDWLFRDAAGNPMTPTPQNKALLLQRLETHIRAVVGHFGNNVQAWDVVNEIIDPSQSDGYRRTQWFQICGTDYIDRAFQVTREVAPNAKLYINDFSTTNPAKRAFLFNLVRNLKTRGIPIDGVGHQMHSNIDLPSAGDVVDTINLFSTIPGIDNQVTEMDISVYNNGTQMYSEVPAAVIRRHGNRYRDLFNAFRQLQGKISSVTLWGMADDNSWLSTFPITRLEAPLPFDDLLQAKPAFWGILNLLGTPLDYDADGRSDISIFRPSVGDWYVQRSTGGLIGARFGVGSDRIVPADYDGDGRTDIAVYRPESGSWFVLNSLNFTFSGVVFGLANDLPSPGDFDGDGKADISVFRPSSGIWFRTNSSNGQFAAFPFGIAGDKPTPYDFDGDGRADFGVYRPSNGIWFQTLSANNSFRGEGFGAMGDTIVPADYDGDRKTDLAVYRPSNGTWYIRSSRTGGFTATGFGASTDVPAPGDFDGDGKADICVFRPSEGQWYRMNSSTGQFNAFPFGISGDRPTQSAFQ